MTVRKISCVWREVIFLICVCFWVDICFESFIRIHATISLMWKQHTWMPGSFYLLPRLIIILYNYIMILLLIEENWVKMERIGYSFLPRWNLLMKMWLQSIQDNLVPFPQWLLKTYTFLCISLALSTQHFDGALYLSDPNDTLFLSNF